MLRTAAAGDRRHPPFEVPPEDELRRAASRLPRRFGQPRLRQHGAAAEGGVGHHPDAPLAAIGEELVPGARRVQLHLENGRPVVAEAGQGIELADVEVGDAHLLRPAAPAELQHRLPGLRERDLRRRGGPGLGALGARRHHSAGDLFRAPGGIDLDRSAIRLRLGRMDQVEVKAFDPQPAERPLAGLDGAVEGVVRLPELADQWHLVPLDRRPRQEPAEQGLGAVDLGGVEHPAAGAVPKPTRGGSAAIAQAWTAAGRTSRESAASSAERVASRVNRPAVSRARSRIRASSAERSGAPPVSSSSVSASGKT